MADIGALALRMVVSLAIVLGVVAVAFLVARRRQQGLTMVGPSRRRPRQFRQAGLTIESRAGLARGASAVAVRFGDQVVLVGVTDGAQSSVLAEIPADEWDRSVAVDETELTPVRTPIDPNAVVSPRPTFIEALRDATSRTKS